jgi:hypothetical protein
LPLPVFDYATFSRLSPLLAGYFIAAIIFISPLLMPLLFERHAAAADAPAPPSQAPMPPFFFSPLIFQVFSMMPLALSPLRFYFLAAVAAGFCHHDYFRRHAATECRHICLMIILFFRHCRFQRRRRLFAFSAS